MIYRALTTFAGPVAGAAARIAGPDWRERMVLDAGPAHRPGGVWLHGASVGELNSGRRIVEALGEALGRDLPVVVTANTVTGRAVAAGWGVPARLAPLDLPGAVDRFLDRHRPAVLVTLENEIWPNRAAAARSRGIAQVVAGARMSARSAARWSRARGLIGPVLGGLDALSAQDGASESRLIALGLSPGALLPRLQLKLLDPAATPVPPASARRDRTWLAASTHAGEEELVLDAFLQARARVPDLQLILAPRHPRRGDEVAAMIRARGLDAARRFVRGAWLPAMEHMPLPPKDPKTALQEWLMARGLPLPIYLQDARSGPPHAPVFTISVTAAGHTGVGTAGSKRLAERDAAAALLERLTA